MTTHARTTPPNTELDLPLLPKGFEWRVTTWSNYNSMTGETVYLPRVELWRRGPFDWKRLNTAICDGLRGESEGDAIEYQARRIANEEGFAPTTPVPDSVARYVGTYARKEN